MVGRYDSGDSCVSDLGHTDIWERQAKKKKKKKKKCFDHAQKVKDSDHPVHAQSQPGLCSPLVHSIAANIFNSGQQRP